MTVPLGNIDGWPAEQHPDLVGRVTVHNLQRTSFAPFSWNADHATGCAGLALAAAPRAHMHVVPIWTPKDTPTYWYAYTRTRMLDSAYRYFVSQGVKCINRELNSARSPYGMETIWGPNDLDLVAKYPQMVHVQPAGNQGLPIANQVYYKPAATLEHLLIVVGLGADGKVWAGSNTPQGRCLYVPNVRPIPPENYLRNFVVCAPAVNDTQPGSPDGYNRGWAGTSFASPHAQALVALMYEKAPDLTPQACARIIKETCTPLGPAEIYGHGRINVQAALEAVQ